MVAGVRADGVDAGVHGEGGRQEVAAQVPPWASLLVPSGQVVSANTAPVRGGGGGEGAVRSAPVRSAR
jgi:hypothetical protein